MNFLSPDSLSYSFDDRANGYARGEGVVAIVVKPLADALRDHDVVRAVIRATGSNQDGRTPGLTQPSAEAQEILIRHVYQKAGLTLEDTRYVEAHGTGTPTGDPIEMKAIGRVFRTHRSSQHPLYVGSVKANIGHLEGGSGLAGIIKTILTLEKGVIPPNALFKKMNPAIDAEFFHVQVPTKKTAWPTPGLRRASVNSFGIGGSNAHAVLDDAQHYLQDHGLVGYHNCTMYSSNPGSPAVNGSTYFTDEGIEAKITASFVPYLLVWTAADAGAIERVVRAYQSFYQDSISGGIRKLDQLAYTLAKRRSHMPWRSFAVVDPTHGLNIDANNDQSPLLPTVQPVQTSSGKLSIAFVFTGQGAQYIGMGLELLRYPTFAKTLRRIDAVLAIMGCTWSLFDALEDQDRVDSPEYSQVLCTALQLALVELLKDFELAPGAVIGHSSGEIAAAYAVGALSLESACKVAYYRGQVVGKLRAAMRSAPGAMVSVNLSEADIWGYVEKIGVPPHTVHVACVNSPINCTLSADEVVIDKIKQQLDADDIFAQKLKTGVAYHSPAMRRIAVEYLKLLGSLKPGLIQGSISMISTVTSQVVATPDLLSAQYWVDNLVSPVRFVDVVQSLVKGTALKIGMEGVTDIVEIGPHAALRRPVLDTLSTTASRIRYHTILQRSKSPLCTTLALLGTLFCHGYPVSVAAGNGHEVGMSPPHLINCPQYPFDHSRKYWTESRLSKDYRLRPHSDDYLLGKRSHDWNPLRPSFRNWLSVKIIPWLGDHIISNSTICPGAGMIVMALEAVRQCEPSTATRHPISGFLIKEAKFLHPIPVVDEPRTPTETCLYLRPMRKSHEQVLGWSEIVIFAYHDDRWTECFQAHVQVQYGEATIQSEVDGGQERQLEEERILGLHARAMTSCTLPIDSTAFYDFLRARGLTYGSAFRLLQNMHWDGQDKSTAEINPSPSLHQASDSPVHPAVLDAAVHLILSQVSKGMSETMPTLVPQRVCNAWISAQPWITKGASVRLTSIVKENNGREVKGCLYALADNGSPLCAIENIFMVPVSRDNSSPNRNQLQNRRLLYAVEWKPQLSGLRANELQRLCDSQVREINRKDTLGITKLNSTMRKVACHAIRALSDVDLDSPNFPSYLSRFAASLKQYEGQENESISSWGEIQALLEECEAVNPIYRLFTEFGRNLRSTLRGGTDTLELLYASDAAETFYGSVFNDLCDARFEAFLDLASHQNPGLRIVEVGAGTGGLTRNVLGALRAFEQRAGSSRFAEYTYTDVSPVFFEAAQAKFTEFTNRLVFKKLDLERDPREEGFELGAYDIVIAGSVLHATARLALTMANVRALLRPGGYLVNVEITAPDSAWANVGFGSLPGWWLSTEPWRQHGPLVTEQTWQALAQEAGFSGIDLCLRINGDVSLMVSTAVEQGNKNSVALDSYAGQFQYQLILLVDPGKGAQLTLASHISKQWRNVQIVHFDRVHECTWADTGIVLSLLEVGIPRLAKLGEHDFGALKLLMQRTQKMLWVTVPSIDDGAETEALPQYGLAEGLMRVIRSEEPTKHIVTLAVESFGSRDLEVVWAQKNCAGYVMQVIKSCFEDTPSSPELEFVVREGHLTIGRLVYRKDLDEDRRARIQPQMRDEPWMSGPALTLEVGVPGMLDTLRFVDDAQYAQKDLRSGEVEIETKAWPISFRDVFIALGRLGQEELGFECAGIVTRVGSAVKFRPGDRVCMVRPGCMRTYLRAPASAVFKIPDSLPFHDAVAAVNPGMTAYHALINIARLQEGEKVLIHSAAGSTGQMAIWIAKRVGAEIFATVGFDKKKQLLVDTFEVSPDHIFYSRNTSFAQGIMRITNGCGVDVVLNSLSGDKLEASWECIAPYGRFVEIGKMDIGANASLPMAHFAKNVSFCAIDLHHIAQTNVRLTGQLVQAVMDLIALGEAACPTPLHVYPATQVEKAFRYMQSGRNTGRIIIDISHDYIVPVSTSIIPCTMIFGYYSY